MPGGHVYRVLALLASLTSSATAAQRNPRLQCSDGTGVFLDIAAINGQQAGVTHRYQYAENMAGYQAAIGVANTLLAAAASTAATGTALSYTVPAGGTADLVGASFFLIGGTAPTVALQLVRGATTVTLWSGSASTFQAPTVQLLAGDTIRWQVTAGGAGSTADFSLSVVPDLLAAGSAAEVISIPPLTLEAGWTIGTLTDNLQVGDQWGVTRLMVEDTTVRQGVVNLGDLPDLRVEVVEAMPPGMAGV